MARAIHHKDGEAVLRRLEAGALKVTVAGEAALLEDGEVVQDGRDLQVGMVAVHRWEDKDQVCSLWDAG